MSARQAIPGSGTRPVLMQMPSDLVAYVFHALRLHADLYRRNGMHAPDGVDDLVSMLASNASQGQRGTRQAEVLGSRHVEPVTPRLVSYETTAAMLDCSQRQVQRLVTAGILTPVSVGGLKRLRIADIDDFIAGAGAEPVAAESRQ